MNTIKTLSALFLLTACSSMTGCAEGSRDKTTGSSDQSSSSTDPSRAVPAGPTKSTTPVSPDELIDFRDDSSRSGAPKDTSDYGAIDGTYRLYGVDGAGEGRVATIAEVGTWTTRQYKLGDAFGRGLVVSKIDDEGVTLHGTQADVRLAIGADADLRVIRHDLDVVAQPLGKHRFRLSTQAARSAVDVNPTRPIAEKVDLYELTMLKLGPIPAKGLWAATDFREGDLIAAVDGQSVEALGDGALATIETALTTATKLDLTIYRGGVSYHRRYEVDAVR